jgi:hypothetical protein
MNALTTQYYNIDNTNFTTCFSKLKCLPRTWKTKYRLQQNDLQDENLAKFSHKCAVFLCLQSGTTYTQFIYSNRDVNIAIALCSKRWGLDWFLPKGSYQKVPTKTFLQKKAPETQRFLPKRSCQKGSWKYRSWAIRLLSTRLPGPYGSCRKHSHVHMVPRSKWFPISFF